ncbi:MAG: hypothetical protein KME15_00920 [Drouetiella hepatica Uher 2000/2452]|jgi:predicted HicB family RNase H-like nuclease|uniref:Uncharacterized protein n=1 Tax=Drouetiella hepatica Uher 2000/2452 TaxID=904376 RepID=A0A951Q8G4_9CYAN|nr:hypothetical protein [Drouetiella hepatica Uher 2000/2452]
MTAKPRKDEIRVNVQPEITRLLKTIAGIKDTSLNALVNLAIERFIEDEDTQELIKRFNLDRLEDLDE